MHLFIDQYFPGMLAPGLQGRFSATRPAISTKGKPGCRWPGIETPQQTSGDSRQRVLTADTMLARRRATRIATRQIRPFVQLCKCGALQVDVGALAHFQPVCTKQSRKLSTRLPTPRFAVRASSRAIIALRNAGNCDQPSLTIQRINSLLRGSRSATRRKRPDQQKRKHPGRGKQDQSRARRNPGLPFRRRRRQCAAITASARAARASLLRVRASS